MSDILVSTWYHAVGAYDSRRFDMNGNALAGMEDLPLEVKIKIFLALDDNTARANFCFAHQEFRPLCDMYSDTMFFSALESIRERKHVVIQFLKSIQNADKRRSCAKIFLASPKIQDDAFWIVQIMKYVVNENLFSYEELAPYLIQSVILNKRDQNSLNYLANFGIQNHMIQPAFLHDIYMDALDAEEDTRRIFLLLKTSLRLKILEGSETPDFFQKCLTTYTNDFLSIYKLARKYNVDV